MADQEWNREWAVDMLRSTPSLGLIAQDFAYEELYPAASFFLLTFYHFIFTKVASRKTLFGNLVHARTNMHILKEVQFVEMQKEREERCYC